MPLPEPPRIPLANLPTPLVRLGRLEGDLGGNPTIWLKRDDLTGLELSGNKVRKLEYIVAEAIASGFDTIVTEGTPQSNHCRATAAVCARLGLRCRLLFRPMPPAGQMPQGNHFLDVLFGAECCAYEREHYMSERDGIIAKNTAELRAMGRSPRFVPAGASEPLGCWGYIRAATELAEQLGQVGIRACDILLPISSAGTCAGIVLGRLLHGCDAWTLRAVPVSDDIAFQERAVRELCRAAIELYSLPISVGDDAVRFIDGYVGRGYAIPYEACVAAVQNLARLEGIILDPVYTAKAFCALLDGVRKGHLGHDRPVVFLHTGGSFSNFAWPDVLTPASASASSVHPS